MTSPFKLGVNGYAFAVTNNGHVIFHPDWRPVLPDDILKPNYNSIDVMEIELMDNDTCFRNNDTGLYEMRKDMVDQVAGHRNLRIRVHQDNFKRVTIRNQKYEYRKLDNTSYSLAISVPQNMYRFKGVIDVTRVIRDGKLDVVKLFDVQKDTNPRKWKLHPDWSYCWYIKTPEGKERTKDKSAQENLLMYFIKKIQTTTHKNWMWKNLMKSQEEIYHCDRDLVQSLVFDANITEVFSEEKLWRFNKDDPLHSQFIKMYGVHLAFIATRTGLTRWIGPLDKDRPLSLSDVNFEDNNIRAIDELWYKRAVERWYVDPESFVYSIPFDAGTRTDNLVTVTATRAIFIENKGHHAPVAVTGIQFDHAEWRKKFFETTSKCMAGSSNCQNRTCDSGTLDCYVLDDNGYVLISEKVTDHGKFFGDIDGMVMEMMVKSEIYKQVRVVDYQATCLHPVSRSSFADFLKTPFHALKWLLNIALSYVAWLALELNVHSLVAPDFTSVLAEYAGDEGHIIEDQLPFLDLASINKTRLRPCDQEYKLYTYGSTYNAHNMTQKGKLTSCGHNSDCSGFFNVHIIPHTNLILVVTDGTCRCPNTVNNHSVKPEEVKYDVVESVGNLSKVNEIVDQICRTPNYPPLYRNRMYNETQCRHYHAEEESMKADCGLGTTMKPNYIITLAPLALIFILLKVVFAF
ncbi:unnamed protein product [Allacma fusca]|uniref:Voltage-dependent calcium channel alpha-2/delta subunit conserved region domain-containing protein n=1 Tax=Allacma fusca TaxID=39272 RepID=A0A8J2PR80_9HEXA|nr:unnamed protein product [Allacma fusca]